MADLSDITLSITFGLGDNDAFWADVAQEAARIDEENSGEPQAVYSQGQALTVLFHQDGVDTILSLAHKHGIIPGWSVDGTWESLAEIGSAISVPEGA